MKRVLIPILMFISGGAILGAMVFAHEIGIDPNVQWGKDRILGAAVGVLILILAAIISLYFDPLADWGQKIFAAAKPSKLEEGPTRYRMTMMYLSSGLLGIIIVITYVWFISVGTWNNWPRTNDYRGYFDQLGKAFDQGKLYIQTKPAPALLLLSNPYDPLARKQIPQADTWKIWDLSLYNGKLYLYWGPIPALIIAAIKPFLAVEVDDQYLVFAFILCLFFSQSLLILKIWSDFFDHLPAWTVLMSVVLGGFINPIPWILSQPRIYEAAIVCGQFFFTAGIYFAYVAVSKRSPSKSLLAMSGFCWACAVGSRAFLLIPILFLVLMVMLRLSATKQKPGEVLAAAAAFSSPLLFGGLLLAWYNWARFGSIFEFGFRYQITLLDLTKYGNDIFSLAYVPINLYVYFLNPPELTKNFPFIKPARADVSTIFHNHLPMLYTTEHIAGPLYAFPFIAFGIISIWAISSGRRLRGLSEGHAKPRPELHRWLLFSLIGSLPFAFSSLLLFFYSAQRYLEDVIPLTFLIATLGFWQGYSLLKKNHFGRVAYASIAVILAFTSIISSFLLSFSADVTRIRSTNPALLTNLILLFLKIKHW